MTACTGASGPTIYMKTAVLFLHSEVVVLSIIFIALLTECFAHWHNHCIRSLLNDREAFHRGNWALVSLMYSTFITSVMEHKPASHVNRHHARIKHTQSHVRQASEVLRPDMDALSLTTSHFEGAGWTVGYPSIGIPL